MSSGNTSMAKTLSKDGVSEGLLMEGMHTYQTMVVGHQSWQALWVFSLYRLALGGLFLLLYISDSQYLYLAPDHAPMFLPVILTYLTVAVCCVWFIYQRRPNFELQVVFQVFTDIAALCLFMRISHGMYSDLGVLINIAIAGGSMLTVGRISLLFAAMATVAIFIERFSSSLDHGFVANDYMSAGALGITFFATAILGYVLSKRVRESEALASRRASDVMELANLNDHVIQRLRSGIIVVDVAQQVRIANAFASHLFDTELSQQPLAMVAPTLYAALQQWQKNPHQASAKIQLPTRGTELMVQFTQLGHEKKSPVLIFLDDSLRTAQQAQEMKLASLGRLSASIAHEIRNPLGAIGHAAQLLEEADDLGRVERRFIEIIHSNSLRMNRIIDNMLLLSRRERTSSIQFELLPWLQDFVQVFQQSYTTPVVIDVVMKVKDVIKVDVDQSQLQQIMHNLCENGLRYSQQKTGHYRLHIGIDKHKDGYYIVDVIDEGPGIDAEIAAQLFEPFFTTQNNGTGLGLYIAKELAEANQIHLDFFPSHAGGCCFRLKFMANWE